MCERENESDSLKEGNSKKIEMAIEPYVIGNDEITKDEICVHRRNMYTVESESNAVD